MNGSSTYSWFRLFSIKGFGAVTINRITAKARAQGLTIPEIFEIDREKSQQIFPPKGGEIYTRLHEKDDAVFEEYNRLLANRVEIIHPEHPFYPSKLRTLYLDQAPVMLFAMGAADILHAAGVSIVGSREADDRALDFSMRSAGLAVSAGFNVISGYARGVDTSAHFGAIKADGTTTIVLSYGLDHFRFKSCFENTTAEKNSLIISQFHPREAWSNNNGMIRNRLIVGLSSAVIIITAEEKSGTLNTGNLALKTGLPLFVFSPKLFLSPPKGSVQLIEKGGTEIDSFPQLMECLKEVQNRKPPLDASASNNQVTLPL
jgi:DNA processing protein